MDLNLKEPLMDLHSLLAVASYSYKVTNVWDPWHFVHIKLSIVIYF